jgi:hypothetical protein
MSVVYLVWDNSRAEHGEGPSLVGVYATREVAEEVEAGLDLDNAVDERVVEEEAIL